MKKIARGVTVTRARLSVGVLELFRFDRYDHAFPRHAHERFTFGIFGPGNGSIRIRGAEWRAPTDSILAIAPDEAHSADPGRGGGWTYRSLYPSQEVVAAALGADATDLPRFDQPVIQDASLAHEIGRLHRRMEREPGKMGAEEDLLIIVRKLARRHGKRWQEPRKEAAAAVVARARTFLEEHAAAPIRLQDLSAICGVGPFHLIRCFHQVVGMPPHAWLTQLRANRARVRLLAGESPSTVAYRCGFSDQSHLTRTFRRIFGLTPGAYLRGRIPRST